VRAIRLRPALMVGISVSNGSGRRFGVGWWLGRRHGCGLHWRWVRDLAKVRHNLRVEVVVVVGSGPTFIIALSLSNEPA
jgi:hypothetical protein